MLNKKIAIYVPGTININEAMPAAEHKKHVERVASAFCAMFGGATAEPVTGFWKSANGDLIKEQITIIYAFATDKDLELFRKNVIHLAAGLRDDLKQECVSVEIDGELLFI